MDSKTPYKANLIKQQKVCERNFHKLMKLLPDLENNDNLVLSFYLAGWEGQARFQVLERAPYTTVLHVNLDAAWGQWLKLPEFRIRIYRDVRMAEIISVNKDRHFKAIYPYPNEKMLMPDEKEQLNQLFSEWLNFCLTHGLNN